MHMPEVADADWVHGRSEWWGSTAGRGPMKSHGVFGKELDEGVEKTPVPEKFHWEINPPPTWKLADKRKGGTGWMRQRFKPPARSILLPCSWSLFFLIATTIPLALPGRTPNDQATALILFFCTWGLIFIPAWMAQNEMPRGGGWLIGKNTLGYLCIGGIIFPLHIIINVKLGWVSFAFFCIAWYTQIRRFQEGFKAASNRWLLPFNPLEWEEDIINENWEIISIKWRNGPIAKHSIFPGLELHGTHRGKDRFIALHYHGLEGWLNDPFTTQLQSEKIHEFLKNPPIRLEGEQWTKKFLQNFGTDESE